MKKTYTTPKLIIHGTVDEITQAFGPASVQDTIFFGGTPIAHGTGSQDGVVVPG